MNKIKNAFEPIVADENIKNSTYDFLLDKLQKQEKRSFLRFKASFAAAAMFFIVIISGLWFYSAYNTPVSFISIDINPSVELSLNRFERVISADAYNDDGEKILANIDFRGKAYTAVIEMLFSGNAFSEYITDDSVLNFTVASDKQEEIIAGIQNCNGYKNYVCECSGANSELVEQAHEHGISFGKYKLYLEILQYDESITPEDCADMSMKELRNILNNFGSGQHGNGTGDENHGEGGGEHKQFQNRKGQ